METLRELGNVGLGIGVIAVLIWAWMVAAARKASGVGENPNARDDTDEE